MPISYYDQIPQTHLFPFCESPSHAAQVTLMTSLLLSISPDKNRKIHVRNRPPSQPSLLKHLISNLLPHLSRISVLLSFHCVIVLWSSLCRYRLSEAVCFSSSLICCSVCCLQRHQALCKWLLSSCRIAWQQSYLSVSDTQPGSPSTTCSSLCFPLKLNIPSSQKASAPFASLIVPTRCKTPMCADAAWQHIKEISTVRSALLHLQQTYNSGWLLTD